MPQTTGDYQSFLDNVLQMTKQTPADGTTFDSIHKQLLNNDTTLWSLLQAFVQGTTNSGVLQLASITAGLTSTLNAFKFGKDTALVTGILQQVTNLGGQTDGSNLVQLDAPPASNVTPSLQGSARDDLVFLEFWRDATSGAWKSRTRVVDGVDFVSYPTDGFSNGANSRNGQVLAQGGTATPQPYSFNRSDLRNIPAGSTDTGMYVAGNGDSASIAGLNTLDGYSYAIPLFRVRRRNSQPFDPDTNPMGGKQYYVTTTATGTTFATALAPGQSGTVTFESSVYNQMTVGDVLADNYVSGGYLQVTSLNGSNQATVANVGTKTISAVGANWYVLSDRPDGLYSNILDISDIQGGDLRHQVSPTGVNGQALLESGLDKLLRGQLITNAPLRYARDYIGLNLAGNGFTDDVNTLLFVNFDGGSINGTANGTVVTGTAVNGKTINFANGVQGIALAGNDAVSYPINYPTSQPLSIEFFWCPEFASTDGTYAEALYLQSATSGVYGQVIYYHNYIQFDYPGVASIHLNVPTDGTWNPGVWHFIQILVDPMNNLVTINADGKNWYTYPNAGIDKTQTFTNVSIGNSLTDSWANSNLTRVDSVRLSNILRSGYPLPSGYSLTNGDRILDGPSSDFSMWSDDVGGTSGVNGRTNPYGLTHVPNQVAGRIRYNGSEIRHYYGQGVTPGFSVGSSLGTNPVGSFDWSVEFANVTANELPDGTRTTFTFTRPSNAQGIFCGNGNSLTNMISNSAFSPSSISIDGNGTVTVTFSSAPASGSNIVLFYRTGQRHSHFVPSTKGFVIHDWTDDTYTGNGSTTVYQTSKYNIANVNNVRIGGAIQTGGYSATGISARSTITAQVGAGGTSVTVSGAAGFVANQNIRISKGDGTWYTTTISSISGTTLTIPATPAGTILPGNAVIEGAALVTFTSAPASGATVDVVSESVLTPSLGDYIRIHYQHTPYQGTLDTSVLTVLHVGTSKGFVTTKGTGMVDSSPDGSWTDYFPALSTQLPMNGNDYSLKRDTLALSGPTFSTAVSTFYGSEQVNEHTSSTSVPAGHLAPGSTLTVRTATTTNRGVTTVYLYDNLGNIRYPQVSLRDLTTAVPHVAGVPLICMDNSTGELLLVVLTQLLTNTSNEIRIVGPGAMDTFKLPGRPLIKGNGGVAA